MVKIIFSKYSNDRATEFAVRTDICEENGRRFIRKSACSGRAEEHVRKIDRWYQELQEVYAGGLLINRCVPEENSVMLEYLEGTTLEEILDGYLADRKYEKIEALLRSYAAIIRNAAGQQFVLTEQFREVFGTIEEQFAGNSAAVTDIDMTLNNVIVNTTWNLIDYEWSFDFPIPADFVIYRMLFYYFEYTDSRRKMLRERDIYGRFGLSTAQCERYAEMERNFQRYITGNHETLRSVCSRITPGSISFDELMSSFEKKSAKMQNQVQIFWSPDGQFREADSQKFRFEKNVYKNYTVDFPQGIKQIRLDPGEESCMVFVKYFRINEENAEPEQWACNGTYLGENRFVFKEADPQILFPGDREIRRLEAEFMIASVSPETASAIEMLFEEGMRLTEENQKKEDMIRELGHTIEQMKNTKVWKLYSKYRQLKERKQ